jgi:tetratricopeptide (TPR) repeat protein
VYAAILNDWAALHEKFGHHEKAEPLYLEALAVLKEILGERHRDYAFSLDNLAGLYESVGAYEKAEPLYLEAVTIRKAVLGEKHPNYAASLGNLAECVRSKSYRDRATGDSGLRNRLAAIGEEAPDGSRRPHLGQAELMRRLMGVVASQETSNGQAQMSVLRALASEPLVANALAPEANNASLSEPLLRGDGQSQVQSQEVEDPTLVQDAASEASRADSRNHEFQDPEPSGQAGEAAENALSAEQMQMDFELAAALQEAEESGEAARDELQTQLGWRQSPSEIGPGGVPEGLHEPGTDGTEELPAGLEQPVHEATNADAPEVTDGLSAEESGCEDPDADSESQARAEELPESPTERQPDMHIQDSAQSHQETEPQLEGQANACP